jgi:hypothetical protein
MKMNLTPVSPSKEGIGGVPPGNTTAMLHPSRTEMKTSERKISGNRRSKLMERARKK